MILLEKTWFAISIKTNHKGCRDFLKKEFPKKEEKDEPDANKRNEFNREQKKRISDKLELFIKPGNPGVKFKKVYDKMLAKLELPKHVKEQLGISQAAPSGEKAEPAKVRAASTT